MLQVTGNNARRGRRQGTIEAEKGRETEKRAQTLPESCNDDGGWKANRGIETETSPKRTTTKSEGRGYEQTGMGWEEVKKKEKKTERNEPRQMKAHASGVMRDGGAVKCPPHKQGSRLMRQRQPWRHTPSCEAHAQVAYARRAAESRLEVASSIGQA